VVGLKKLRSAKTGGGGAMEKDPPLPPPAHFTAPPRERAF